MFGTSNIVDTANNISADINNEVENKTSLGIPTFWGFLFIVIAIIMGLAIGFKLINYYTDPEKTQQRAQKKQQKREMDEARKANGKSSSWNIFSSNKKSNYS
jgi:uncharacterized protein YpmB